MRRFWDIVAALLLGFIAATRLWQPVADFYSLHIYPAISSCLSLISSIAGFSLYDILVPVLVIAFLMAIFAGHSRLKRRLIRIARLTAWTFIWFYIAWCVNYNRSSIFERIGLTPEAASKERFVAFLDSYTDSLDSSFQTAGCLDSLQVEASVPPLDSIVSGIKTFYSDAPARYGLCKPRSWQQPKWMMYRRLYSKTGVSGYMGPLTGESHLNGDALPSELPALYAHEYAHLLGVSSEAEANWWAYQACRTSSDPLVSYLGYLSILSSVASNARSFLTDEEFSAWIASIDPLVVAQENRRIAHWHALISRRYSTWQSKLYNLFLKSNNIPSGMLNYSQVVAMAIEIPEV